MESLVKRQVGIAFTPHIEIIHRLILDGLAVAQHNSEFNEVFDLRDGAIYYRNMRQTGHTAALKAMSTVGSFSEISTITVTRTAKEAAELSRLAQNTKVHKMVYGEGNLLSRPENLSGLNTQILIFSDYISGRGMIEKGWEIAKVVIAQQPHIKLVVFLG